MSRADELRAWALSKVGCGYVWGARGETCTEALLTMLQAQYPDQTNISTVCRKWLGKPVYDCATLVRYGLKAVGITICSGASSQWRGDYWTEKGPISAMPKGKVCVLYNESANANPMGHTGINLGDGYAVDARSSARGVIRSALGSRTWSHYAIPRGLYDETAAEAESEKVEKMQAMVYADDLNPVKLRERPTKAASYIAKVPCGEAVEVLEQADGWARVVWGDFQGYIMAEFLDVSESDKAAKATQGGDLEARVATLEAWVAAHDNGGVQG